MRKNRTSKIFFIFLIKATFLLMGFSLLGQASAQERLKGIDLAGWATGQIDWNKLRQEGYKFVFTKATEGSIKGSYWVRQGAKENIKEALNADMLASIFHFALPVHNKAIDEAESFAKFFNELFNELSPESKKKFLIPALDIEDYEYPPKSGNFFHLSDYLSKKELTDWIHEWMNTVKTLTDVEPILYVLAPYYYAGYANYLEDSVAQYNLWISDHRSNIAFPDIGIWGKMGKDWDFWQWLVETDIEGIETKVDLDLFNGGESDQDSFIVENSRPNLKPYQPPDWSDKIVVSNSKGTNADITPLYATDKLYVDWAVINDSPVATPQGFSVALYIDGVLKKTWSLKACLNPNGYWPIDDYSIGKLSAGVHTLKIVADSTGVIQETNKEDNEYIKTITVQCALTLTTKLNLPWAGVVTRNPDKNTYCSGEVVSLTAIPNLGYSFKSWSGVDSSEGTTATVAMNKNRVVIAKFVTYTLKISSSPSGSGTVTRNPDKANYCSGEVVTLTAIPNLGYSFKSWSGVDSSEGSTGAVTINKNRTVKANFIKASTTLSIVTVTPSSWTFTSPGTKQLTATATYTDNSTEDVSNKASWTSSNSNVAAVNNSGLVTSGQNGSTTITATYGGKSGTCIITVNIEIEADIIKTGAQIDSTSHSSQRKLAIESNGTLHTFYHNKDNAGILQIYHAQSSDDGRTWVEEQITTASRDQRFPTLAIDSQDNLHLAWGDGSIEVGNIYYMKKTTVWQNRELLASCAEGPSIAIDSNGDIHVVYGVNTYGYCGTYSQGIRWRKRTSTGWQPEESISGEKYWVVLPALAIDKDNNIHVAWLNAPRPIYYDIHYRKRTLSGWGSETEINVEKNNDWGGYPSIAIDNNNSVYVAWHSRSGNNYYIKCRKYTTSWQPTEDVEGPMPYVQRGPSIAIDGKDQIHVVWSGRHPDSPTYYQLRHREYTASWQPTENLTSSSSADQIGPSLMWALFPMINGVRTNQIEDGHVFIWMDDATIKYWP